MTTPTLLDRARGALRDLADLYDTDEGCRSLPQYIAARKVLADLDRARSWTKAKPTMEGAYYIRGYVIWSDANEPALVQVVESKDGLICNLHQSNTSSDYGAWFDVADLDPDFKWFGPLPAPPIATDKSQEAANGLRMEMRSPGLFPQMKTSSATG
ncbi:MAG: hypothetical protein J0I77_17585 [Rudaea sp.]|uniref:hypothetical protein n=1 Tax=unclassified Rudaea TaxID=2627037 RepID=UPI0010F71473|nr:MULTISPECIES: hypothetical protein [unclassified Rudaea]MBN8887540.1 hypothetical protein [Rudaea sp.]